MDISNNMVDLAEMMYYYQRNIREYTDNIHAYNNNVNTFFNILSTRMRPPPRHTPARNNVRTRETHRPFENVNVTRQQFEDVIVRPTEAQILQALDTFSFVNSSEEAPICPITLEPIQEGEEVSRIRHCGHLFKNHAIQGWFFRNVRCPVCRFDIRNYRSVLDVSGVQQEESTEFDDVIQELAQEGRNFINNRLHPFASLFGQASATALGSATGSSIPLTNTLTSAIRNFVNNELQNLPMNDTTTDLVYTFDLPLTVDLSGNYTL